MIKTILKAGALTAGIWGISLLAGTYHSRAIARDLTEAAEAMLQLLEDLRIVGWGPGQHPRADGFLQNIITGSGVPLSAAAEQIPVPVSRIRRFSLSRVPVRERHILLAPGTETVCMYTGTQLPSLLLYFAPGDDSGNIAEYGDLTVVSGNSRSVIAGKKIFTRPAWYDRETGEAVYEVAVQKRINPAADSIRFIMPVSGPPLLLKGMTAFGYRNGKKEYDPLAAVRSIRVSEITFRTGTGIRFQSGARYLTPVYRQARKFHFLYSGSRPEVTIQTGSGAAGIELGDTVTCGTAGMFGNDGDSLVSASAMVTTSDSILSLIITAAPEKQGMLYGITVEKSSPVEAILAGRPKSVLRIRNEKVVLRQTVQTAMSRFGWRVSRQGRPVAAADQAGLTGDVPGFSHVPVQTADGKMVVRREQGNVTVAGAGSFRRPRGIRLFLTAFCNVLAIAGLVIARGRQRS